MSNTFLIVALVALVAVAALRPLARLQDPRPTPTAIVALVLVLAGVLAVVQPVLGYCLIGAGAAVLAVDAFIRRHRRGG